MARIFQIMVLTLFSFLITPSFAHDAAVFEIVPSSKSIKMLANTNVTLTYTVRNNTNRIINRITINPAYKVNSKFTALTLENNTCANSSLGVNATCTFQINIQNNRSGDSIDIMPRVCGYNGSVCSVPVLNNRTSVTSGSSYYVYIVNDGNNTISACPVNTDSTLGTCSTMSGNGTFNGPLSIALNSSSTIAYITNLNNNTVSICPILADGSFDTCNTSTASGTLSFPSGVQINSTDNLLYISNFGNSTVSICPINTDGSLGSCTTTTGGGTFSALQGLRFNATSTIAYMINILDVAICPINADGSFGTCTINTGNGTFARPQGLDFNVSGDYAYIANFITNTISTCSINNSNGNLSNCTTSTGNGTFNFAFNLVVGPAMTSSNYYGYVPNNGTDTISICPLDANTGLPGTCATSTAGGTLNKPTYVHLVLRA